MAKYAYTIFDIDSHFFLFEGVIPEDIPGADLNAEIEVATTWVTENISFAATNHISLRRMETLEGGYRGIDSTAIIAALGTIADVAATQGGTGTLHAKVRKISSQLNDLAVAGFALNAGSNLIGKVQLRNPEDTLDLGNAANPVRIDPTGVTLQPVSSTQLPASLTGSGNLKSAITEALPAGTNNIGLIDVNTLPSITGTVTANAGTNLNTSSLALESGGNLAFAAASLSVLDDWDETDRVKANIIAGQIGVQGNSGVVSANTQRVVLATDIALPTGANNIGKVGLLSGDLRQSLSATQLRRLVATQVSRLLSSVFEGSSLDTIFFATTVANGGTVTQTGGELTLATNTTANGTAEIHSTREARYIAGTVNQYLANVRLSTATINNTKRWGVFDANNGIFFELSGTTFRLVTRKATVDTVITSFNGTAPTIDTNFHKWEIFYSTRVIEFYQDGILIHSLVATSAIFTQTLTLPTRLEDNNSGGLTTNLTVIADEVAIFRFGNVETSPQYAKAQFSSTVTLKTGGAKIHRVLVNSKGNGGSVLSIYDNTSAAGTPVAAIKTDQDNTPPAIYGLELDTGLTYNWTGTSGDVTIIYE